MLGSPKDAATTLTIDGTSHVQGYDWTVASAACSACQQHSQGDAHCSQHFMCVWRLMHSATG